jgi:hypothetical protein
LQIHLNESKEDLIVYKDLTVADMVSLSPNKVPEITFYLLDTPPPPPPPSSAQPLQNSFTAMMRGAENDALHLVLPDRKVINEQSPLGTDKLFNELIDLASELGAGFRRDQANTVGGPLFRRIASSIFFPLTHYPWASFEQSVPVDCRPPDEFQRFCGFSAIATGSSKKKKPVLDQVVCKFVVNSVLTVLLVSPELNHKRWSGLKKLLVGLEKAMEKRGEFLNKKAAAAMVERSLDEDQGQLQHRQDEDNLIITSYEAIRPSVNIKPEYARLNAAVLNLAEYETLSLQDYLPQQDKYNTINFSMVKSRWIKGIALRARIFCAKFSQGGPHETLYYIFSVPTDEVSFYYSFAACTMKSIWLVT